jgi:hypothetical protein
MTASDTPPIGSRMDAYPSRTASDLPRIAAEGVKDEAIAAWIPLSSRPAIGRERAPDDSKGEVTCRT